MATPERVAFLRPRDHGRADGRQPGAGGLRGVGLDRTRSAKAERFAGRARRRAAAATPGGGRRGRRRADLDRARRARGGGGPVRRRGRRRRPAEGALAIDMSTIAPTASRRIAERLRARLRLPRGARVGSRPKAEDGTLTIMVGAERADLNPSVPQRVSSWVNIRRCKAEAQQRSQSGARGLLIVALRVLLRPFLLQCIPTQCHFVNAQAGRSFGLGPRPGTVVRRARPLAVAGHHSEPEGRAAW